MESIHRRNRILAAKWLCYVLLLLAGTALQTMPGFLKLGRVKPLFILPLCLAVTFFENEFSSALFGMVGGLLWDYAAGRTVGLFAIELLLVCFAVSVVEQLYLKPTALNYFLVCGGVCLLVLSLDFLFYYLMPGYAAPWLHYLWFVVPTGVFSGVVGLVPFRLCRLVHTKFYFDN